MRAIVTVGKVILIFPSTLWQVFHYPLCLLCMSSSLCPDLHALFCSSSFTFHLYCCPEERQYMSNERCYLICILRNAGFFFLAWLILYRTNFNIFLCVSCKCSYRNPERQVKTIYRKFWSLGRACRRHMTRKVHSGSQLCFVCITSI